LALWCCLAVSARTSLETLCWVVFATLGARHLAGFTHQAALGAHPHDTPRQEEVTRRLFGRRRLQARGQQGFQPRQPFVGARHVVAQGVHLAWRLASAYAEHLKEETPLLCKRTQVDAWHGQVDALRDDVARADKRLARLEALLAARLPAPTAE
jgi:hypothetical protein